MWNIDGFATYMEVHPQIAAAMFKMMDDDDDGTLTFDEFVRGYGFITKGDPANRLNLLFKIFDLDGSDTLDKAETKVMVRTILTSFHETAQTAEGPGGTSIAARAKIMKAKAAGEKLSPERVAKQFEKEVIKTSDAIFNICDKNQDGAIDRKEFLMCLEPKSDKDTSPKCIEIAKILSLFEGGSLKQWNALGKFIEVNGAMPSESDYTTTSEAVKIEAFTEDAPRSRSPTMSPGCNQQ
ncbi:hypothetical protein TrCOL_g12528 [Triparma columacea]|uniref:EF-hand domain-containing protein n=1 Tax=Triparma columacea TaxID=722753 RepID=A0A9W7FYU7_9STRA|nr:hypothetical protein TrCOL_g12528 [Triparma columacea]